MTYQNWGWRAVADVVTRGKFITLSVHIRKKSLKSIIQVSSIHHKKLEKDEEDESKASERK